MDDDKQGVPTPDGEAPYQVRVGGGEAALTPSMEVVPVAVAPPPPPPPPPPAPPSTPEEEEEQGMLRMSFMEHLEELRGRIIKAVYGLVVAFVISLVYAGKLWDIISDPAVEALKHLHVDPPELAQLTPMEGFSIIWVKLPLLCSLFIASPWIVYQIWAFIAPGLYKKERRWALPFVLITAGLFIIGGLFAYFLAFRFGLEFLLGIGMSNHVRPVVSITEYFDLFMNVTLGVGLIFELPVLIFLLTLLHIVSPRFLLRHSRYAILIIVIAAAIITPTPDVVNLMLFAVPMCALYFVGVFLGVLVVLRREGQSFPWKTAIRICVIVALVLAALYGLFSYFHLHLQRAWPYITR
ncbi:MAG TPA: twin-arginine translocase subunit TatC [Bryobacteraceae bacterium]|nr:twin-arginine translocase subunit TatC [Bryobacteraceae bacterium]